MTAIRSLAFNLAFFLWTALAMIAFLPVLLMPYGATYWFGRQWVRVSLWFLKHLVGLDHRVVGLEHARRGPAIYAAKHQSSWDTLIFALYLHLPAYVLKRELLFLPLFGFYLRKAGHIAVDRSAGASALKRMLAAAKLRRDQGRDILIFPEGTRVAVGSHRPFQPGVAALYGQLDLPVVPVALNSGLYWGRRSFHKKPGTITLEFLPAIPPGLPRRAFMAELEKRLEAASMRLAKVETDGASR
ncbi:MAG TPA: lysophospholipid acyltransferase family protein [Candidatus Udaeobacter sp.]|nr:lysophospholipid acyltransferase family protein [Candidatus Udaeobacter sp.]